MRLIACLWLALLSAQASGAAVRPRYGGTLRLEMRAAPAAWDPKDPAIGPLASLVFEHLGALAISWQHDAEYRRWEVRLRPGVKFHDGFPLVAGAVVSSLQPQLAGVTLSGAGESLVMQASDPRPELPEELAHSGFIFAPHAEGGLVGTGPFRLAAWEPGRRAIFTANEDYWGGRPFLDGIEVVMGRPLREQLVELELGRVEIVEIGPAEARRAGERGLHAWSSAPVILVALASGAGVDARLQEALALSIDRAAIHNVLLERRGEIAGGLLPQWLSGYAFLFPTAADLPRARRLAAALPPAARSAALAYEASDPLARSIAERIAVNARDSGISLHLTAQNPAAGLRLVGLRLRRENAARALSDIAGALGLAEPFERSSAPGTDALYRAERSLLETGRVIPLFHLPETYGVSPRVKLWRGAALTGLGEWHLEDAWLAAGAP